MNLHITKEEAITEHRKMWNWIADRLEEHNDPDYYDIYIYKIKYIKEHFPNDMILNNCFCCQYAVQEMGNSVENYCIYCPLRWGTENNTDEFFCEQGICDIPDEEEYGLWLYAQRLLVNHNYKEAAQVARQIANLPER